MSGAVAPDSPLPRLEEHIAARLRPLDAAEPGLERLETAGDGGLALDPDLDLDAREERLSEQGDAPAPAAVLVPLVERPDGLTVLLTRRADTLTRHSGQIAFPGGRRDPGETAVQTALRESEEEIGLDRAFVRPIGLGDACRSGTGFIITPVVAFVRPGFSLQPHDAEVAEIFETPFAFLMDPANHDLRSAELGGRTRRFYAMPYQNRTIWGVTAGMIRTLYERWFG